jgi:hypothetical protein
MQGSLQRVHIDLFLQVHSQECRAYVHLMDLDIVLGGDGEWQPNLAQASSRCIRGLVVDSFDFLISSQTSLALNRCTLPAPSCLILYTW